ncbi:glycosyltransferase family 61 protein [Synechococcus sp. ATX 2A4]|uniref:glycosyltransferase 61 family protein n=1 Tax=Synechococcus sp. ATX 2A4 TaxID=2823727 RepID=UPI0020CD8AE7|nr:glycosyltransferase 61 family protein [Synechococcus sp. ATX 2A4]MCP9886299.1 glycosyltransferase family 61 protein [Synechococcus sp. ATX 2A4]
MDLYTELNVKISPFDSLIHLVGSELHKGGPLWNDWDNCLYQRHWRGRNRVDTMPQLLDYTSSSLNLDTGYWCGPITKHYGHQIAEFTTRLPVYLGLHSPSEPLIFGIKRNAMPQSIPSFMKQLLVYFQIPWQNIHLCNSSISVKKLKWTPQQEISPHGTPSEDYIQVLTSHADQVLAGSSVDARHVYVSRAGLTKGSVAGESYLEEFFVAKGYTVIRPENHGVIKQLSLYQGAQSLIFMEGSALHTLQLLGRLGCRVLVIGRRPGLKMARPQLQPRMRSLEYLDAVQAFSPGIEKTVRPADAKGITVLDAEILKAQLESFGVSTIGFDSEEYYQRVKYDISRWFLSGESLAGPQAESARRFATDNLAPFM